MGSTFSEVVTFGEMNDRQLEPKEPRYCDLEEILPGYVGINEAARYLNIHFLTVVGLIGNGLLPASFFKGMWSIERNALQAFGGVYNSRTAMYGPLFSLRIF